MKLLKTLKQKHIMVNTNYSIKEAAEMFGLTRKELFNFLRRYNLLNGTVAALEFVLSGYFIQIRKEIKNKGYNKNVDVVLITDKGVKWLQKVLRLFKPNIYEQKIK